MTTYVYRLVVTYPEKPTLPQEYDDIDASAREYLEERWSWPRSRHYLSRASAERRATLLRSLGAEVEVIRSSPVVFGGRPKMVQPPPSIAERSYEKLVRERTEAYS